VEEFRLEVEVARLIDELEDLHKWQNVVLKHGSYAEAYLEKLKCRVSQEIGYGNRFICPLGFSR